MGEAYIIFQACLKMLWSLAVNWQPKTRSDHLKIR